MYIYMPWLAHVSLMGVPENGATRQIEWITVIFPHSMPWIVRVYPIFQAVQNHIAHICMYPTTYMFPWWYMSIIYVYVYIYSYMLHVNSCIYDPPNPNCHGWDLWVKTPGTRIPDTIKNSWFMDGYPPIIWINVVIIGFDHPHTYMHIYICMYVCMHVCM